MQTSSLSSVNDITTTSASASDGSDTTVFDKKKQLQMKEISAARMRSKQQWNIYESTVAYILSISSVILYQNQYVLIYLTYSIYL